MTSIEWLIDQLPLIQQEGLRDVWEQAKEMYKQEIMNTYIIADSESTIEDSEHNALKFYERTYVNKGSDNTLKDYHIVEANEMVEFPKQETLYTEEQVREAMVKARLFKSSENADIIIQSLKQPKQ